MINSTVYISHAISDEHKSASGGQAGDQTGREVLVSEWFLSPKGWVVLRCKDRDAAKKIAYDARAAAENPKIGYDQNERNTLFHAAEKVGFACALVETACECDCSSLVRVCLWYAGIKVGHFNTASEVDTLLKTGKFELLDTSEYTEHSDRLMEGDILVTRTKGHTCVVLNDGKNADVTPAPAPTPTPEPEPEPEPDPTPHKYRPVVYVKGGSVSVRAGDNVDTPRIGIAHRGEELPYLGKSQATGWYYVNFHGKRGYISNKPRYTEVRYVTA